MTNVPYNDERMCTPAAGALRGIFDNLYFTRNFVPGNKLKWMTKKNIFINILLSLYIVNYGFIHTRNRDYNITSSCHM